MDTVAFQPDLWVKGSARELTHSSRENPGIVAAAEV